jgi:hypothetical protein
MRIRTIKPEFFEDERLALLPPHARLLFIACWMMADRNGVLENRPALLKARVFPYEIGEKSDPSRLLPMLFPDKFLVPFDAEGKSYLWIPGFDKHQRISGKEFDSDGKYPVPSLEITMGKQLGSEGEVPEKPPGAQEQGTGNREQGKDKASQTERMKRTAQFNAEFDSSWSKILKLSLNSKEKEARKAWTVLRKDGISPELIIKWYEWLSSEKTGGDEDKLRYVPGFHNAAGLLTVKVWVADNEKKIEEQRKSDEAIRRTIEKMNADCEARRLLEAQA